MEQIDAVLINAEQVFRRRLLFDGSNYRLSGCSPSSVEEGKMIIDAVTTREIN